MTRHTEQDKDWNRTDWAGSVTDDPRESTAPEWNKTEWVGDQGEGMPLPVPPEEMPEGDTSISGNRHPSGEQHWADTGTRPLERSGDLPVDPLDPAEPADRS